jgi:hypothetical protein
MIAGLLIGKIFGQTRKAGSTSTGMEVREVWGPKQGWMAFPNPLLPVTASDKNSIPAILKSISIAIVEAGRTASSTPLMPYMRLKDVGREVTTPAGLDLPDRDSTDASNLIEHWVQTGALPQGAPAMPDFPTDIGPVDVTTPSGRLDALSKEIDLVRNEYKALWSKLESADWRDIPRIYELKGDIDQAINAIHDYVSSISFDSSSSRISD